MRPLSSLFAATLVSTTLLGLITCLPVKALEGEDPFVDTTACAYNFFLKGSQAEYDHLFAESLAAFEEALICDPDSLYIAKKLPVLHFRLGNNDKAIELLQENIAKDREDISQYLLLAHLAIQKNDREEAIDVYREALKYDPTQENVRLRLAILLVQENRLDEGEQLFRDLIADEKALVLARRYLARLLQMKGRTDDAAVIYEDALTARWSADLAFEMIDFYAALQQYDQVIRLYDSILANDSSNEQALIGRVQTLLTIGRDEEALVDLQGLRKENAHIPSLDMAIAKTLLRLEKVEEAKEILQELQDSPLRSEASYLLGLVNYQERRMESALSFFQQVEADASEYSDAVFLQVRILRDFDRYDRAFSLLFKVTSTPEGRVPLFFALLSSLYQEQEKIDEAMETLESGIVLFPDNEQLPFEIALLLEKQGRRHEALEAMAKVLQINPVNPEALNYIGYTWADLNMNLAEAKDYIEQAITINPENGFIRDSLGWVEYRLGNFETARDELLRALDLEPEDPNIHEHLGDVYLSLDNRKKALTSYQNALEFFIEEQDITRVKGKIDALSK